MKFSDYWNGVHGQNRNILYDDWLDKFDEILRNSKTKILDLGCGVGNDTKYLVEHGYKVLACDYSKVAIETVKRKFDGVETRIVDIAEQLPFKDEEFDVVIADLSLHYFDEKTTFSVMREIKRILSSGGHLIARVNSTEDLNYGASGGEKIEENYYFVSGYNKRFFTLEDADKFFSVIGKAQINVGSTNKYGKEKQLIEICVKK